VTRMFSKNSRYRKLPDEVTLDVKGRLVLGKSLRLPPTEAGSFRHGVDDNDRLDHLGFKYYQQPRKWWRICDANPDFMSPLELLGKTPVVTQFFPLTFNGDGDPPWAVLLTTLMSHVGVIDVSLEEDDETGKVMGVLMVYNLMNITEKELTDIIKEKADFSVKTAQTIGRVGKPITIPPDVNG